MATVTIDLPDEIAQRLQDGGWQDLPRHVLESVALETYRQERLSNRQSGSLLGYDFWQTEEFLKKHDAYLHYDINDFLEDMRTMEYVMQKHQKEQREPAQ